MFCIIVKRLEKTAVLEFVKKMQPHDHALTFYAKPEDKHLVLFTYLQTALKKDGAAVYFFSQENAVQIATAMNEVGIAVDKYMQKGALHLIDQSRQCLLVSEINEANNLDQIKNLHTQLTAKGFGEVRIAEEMAYFLNNGMLTALIEYEKLLKKTLDLPVMMICGYDFDLLCRQGDGDLYLNLIKSHGTIIFAGPKEWVVRAY